MIQDLRDSHLAASIDANSRALIAREPLAKKITSQLRLVHPYTAWHSRQVAELGAMLSDDLGLSEDMGLSLFYAGLFHDGGKSILQQGYRRDTGESLLDLEDLGERERGLLKMHPVLGFLEASGFHDHTVPVAAYGHHRFRAAGSYPNGPIDRANYSANRLIPDAAEIEEAQALCEVPISPRQIEDIQKSVQDPRFVARAIFVTEAVAAIDPLHATWIGPSVFGPREYLRKRLEKKIGARFDQLTPDQIMTEQVVIWDQVTRDYAGDPEIMEASKRGVVKMHAGSPELLARI